MYRYNQSRELGEKVYSDGMSNDTFVVSNGCTGIASDSNMYDLMKITRSIRSLERVIEAFRESTSACEDDGGAFASELRCFHDENLELCNYFTTKENTSLDTDDDEEKALSKPTIINKNIISAISQKRIGTYNKYMEFYKKCLDDISDTLCVKPPVDNG
jgi:hypothetical protein